MKTQIQTHVSKRIKYQKIGTHCVHVASKEKHQHRVFIKEKETSRCNIIYISNAYNAIT